MRKFLKHQNPMFEYAMENTNVALFCEMRLGKTLVAIRWASQPKIKKVLVVAPLPVVRVWEDELLAEEWAEQDIQILKGSKEKIHEKVQNPEARWFLTNYESLIEIERKLKPGQVWKPKKRFPSILEKEWDCIILDESTKIRNPQAKVTKLLQDYAEKFPFKAILTGLPDPESPLDYFEQMRFLYGSFLRCRNYWSFRRSWFWQIGYTFVVPKRTKVALKEALEKQAFSMTRKQAGINIQKVYEKRYVPLTPAQKKLYKQIDKGFEYKIGKEEQQTRWVPVQYQWYGAIAGGFTPEGKFLSDAKVKEIINLLKTELKHEQVVVWFRYTHEIAYVSKALRKAGFKVGIFTGASKDDSEKFKAKKIQVICAQGKCGQYGLNWSVASTAIYYSNWYDGEIRTQSEDRILHPTKAEPLLYIDLIAEDSIDEDVVEILRKKKLNAKEFSEALQERWLKRLRA